MNAEEIDYQKRKWTWANNWQEEGYIEVRQDRFFGGSQWLVDNENVVVKHIKKP